MKQISHERFEDGKVKYEKIAVPEYPKKINLGAQEDKCNLSCPKCDAFVLVYWDKKEELIKEECQ